MCGGTGAWSKPYQENGYDVRNITLPEYDVRLFKPIDHIHGILAAPPCTHLAGSGAAWWKKKEQSALFEALSIVDACLRIILISKPEWWALENPVGRLVHYLGKPKLYFHPCDYGDPYTKKTCLWGKFNTPKMNPVKPEFITTKKGTKYSPIHYLPPSSDRSMFRSITPSGFARAFYEANP